MIGLMQFYFFKCFISKKKKNPEIIMMHWMYLWAVYIYYAEASLWSMFMLLKFELSSF